MNGPEDCDRTCQRRSAIGERVAEPRQEQRAAGDSEQQQRRAQMDRDVRHVVAANVEADDPIVRREGQGDERPPGGRAVPILRQHTGKRANAWIRDDGGLVVENERTREVVAETRNRRSDDEAGIRVAHPRPTGGLVHRSQCLAICSHGRSLAERVNYDNRG